MRILPLALACLSLIAVSGTAWAEEQLVSPSLDGFVLGYEASNADQSLREEVPEGETVEDWSIMVTTQRFDVDGLTLRKFTTNFLSGLREACPDFTMITEPSFKDNIDGTPSMLLSAGCKESPVTGGREMMIVLALQGKEALFVKQVAIRKLSDGNLMRWVVFVGATRLCDGECRD